MNENTIPFERGRNRGTVQNGDLRTWRDRDKV